MPGEVGPPGTRAEPGLLPSGMVTFVFSDIEGSTRAMRRLGDHFPAALERHRELLRQAWSAFGGAEVNTEGDGTFGAFADATRAVLACAESQRLLAAEAWPGGDAIRVRIGLHSGLAAPHDGDYIALAVNQAARVKSAAHGGQILVSEQTAALVELAGSFRLRELGRFRLRDFDDAVRLYQVEGPGLDDDFPALRAMPALHHNLVPTPNRLFGREADIASIVAVLQPGHVLTLTGPAGVGKSRLAAEAAMQAAPEWDGGAWAIDLSALDDRASLLAAIGEAMGVPGEGDDGKGALFDLLREHRTLLLLDGAERHAETCAALVAELLRWCPGLGVLVTGREPLHMPGEQVYPVAPLAVPVEGSTAAEILASPAVQLFVDRAARVRPGFAPFGDALTASGEICRRLGGLPLAIEIAAARSGVMDPAAIEAGLSDLHRLLRSHDRSLPPRQRTLESLLDWSWRLLPPREQAAFSRLAIFSGSFSIDDAVAAIGGDSADAADDTWSLAGKSLLGADLAANGTRYRFLEPVRQYASRRLRDAGDTAHVALWVAGRYLERLGPWCVDCREWLGEMGVEIENVRALVPVVAVESPETAQQLAYAIGRYRDARQQYRAGVAELTRFAGELTEATPARVALLAMLAYLHLRIGDLRAAARVLGEAEAVRRVTGPPPWDGACCERTAGEIACRSGDHRRAASIAEATLGRELAPRDRARMWNLLGLARAAAGDLRGAFAAFSAEREERQRGAGDAFLFVAEACLAEIALRLGETREAAAHQRACLEWALALGQPLGVAFSLITAARLAAEAGAWDIGARLQAKAAALLHDTGGQLYDDDRAAFEDLVAATREQLGPASYGRAAAIGGALETAAAAELADDVLRQAASGCALEPAR